MDKLWAPWRMAYILGAEDATDACIFCQYPSEGVERFRERLVLCATPHAFVIMNKFPYNNGHVLVCPRRHVADLGDLSVEEHDALARLLRETVGAIRAALSPHGVNLGMNLGRAAGAGIDQHCHWHVVPRWNGDTNFMTTVGETKVISEHVAATYERLLPRFACLGEAPRPAPGR